MCREQGQVTGLENPVRQFGLLAAYRSPRGLQAEI